MKKFMKIILIVIIAVVILAGVSVGTFFLTYKPSLTADFSKKTGEISNAASGFLYGFSQPDIPSVELAESIDICCVAQKTYGGLQHPIGDINQVADTFLKANGTDLIVYTQDMYSTWYYQFDSMPEYLEKVKKTVTDIESTNYADRVTYCIFNEMNNGNWFGDFSVYENRLKFYEAWKETFELVRSINPKAKIGGPGYFDYNEENIKEFLQYCKQNNCVPDTMIWHELGGNSLYYWNDHFNSYYSVCDELGLKRMPVNISEYGLMETNGIPGESVKWINRIESTDCEACMAYWRLSNNFSDTVSDDVMPNSNWWVYRWYSEMSGETVETTDKDLFQSNVGKYLKGKSEKLMSKGFSGVATIDEDNKTIQIIAGGSDKNSVVKLKGLDKTQAFGNLTNVQVTIEYVDFKGLSGAVTDSVLKSSYTATIKNGKIEIPLDDILYTQGILITIQPLDKENNYVKNNSVNPSIRYEAEKAKLFGTAKATKDIAYAASGYEMVKADSSKQSGVEFTIDVEYGKYKFDLIYGNGANGVTYDKKTDTYSKGERTNITAFVQIDDDNPFEITLKNTIKDDFTDCVSFYTPDILTNGKHKIKIYISEDNDSKNTVSFDFLDVSEYCDNEMTLIADKDRTTNNSSAFLAIAPKEGYYNFCFDTSYGELTSITVNSEIVSGNFNNEDNLYYATIYLRRGLSYIETNTKTVSGTFSFSFDTKHSGNTVRYNSTDAQLIDNAMLRDNVNAASGSYIDSISSDYPSSAVFVVSCKKSGKYQLTFSYANNEEGGAHDYNVDLVERYITLDINNKLYGNVYFRNTQSWDTYKTKSIIVTLEKGANIITLSNNGSYKFDGKTTYAPNIDYIDVSPIIITD